MSDFVIAVKSATNLSIRRLTIAPVARYFVFGPWRPFFVSISRASEANAPLRVLKLVQVASQTGRRPHDAHVATQVCMRGMSGCSANVAGALL